VVIIVFFMEKERINMNLEMLHKLAIPSNSKIVMLVMDGLGGLPIRIGGKTELETAKKPNLDSLASKSICGLQCPVGSGITPGSGPGHLALFGYDPIKYQVGRGVLSALGIDFEVRENDIVARGNFCTVDEKGLITDRRAGRISSKKNKELCQLLNKNIDIPEVEIFIQTVKEHRFLLVLRGNNLSDDIIDTDPQNVGKKPFEPKSKINKKHKSIDIIKNFINQTSQVLSEKKPVNMILLRGFSKKPDWPMFPNIFKMKSAAISAYPMYRGLAKLVGMKILSTGESIKDEFRTLEKNWDDFEFFYVHYKNTDSSGEDGNFRLKVNSIEVFDKELYHILKLNPDVVIVTGDHSTPSILKSHSWHPVPIMIYSKFCRSDNVKKFNERDCVFGGLGPRLPALDIMPIIMSNALRLRKFGA
jgi:2,3-bisphosphoglycerate-independent phosphoglycerate mutase